MKKEYTKPVVLIESFQMVEHIAFNCLTKDGVTDANYQDPSICYYNDGAAAIFNQGVTGCSFDDYDQAMFGTIENYIKAMTGDDTYQCYGSFSGGQVFAS